MEAIKELANNILKVSLSGVIDEKSNFATTIGPIHHSLIVDCKNVLRINSMGVKSWITYFSQLTAKGNRVALSNCPPCLVDQLSLIENFHSNCEIYSVMVPYECSGCNSEFLAPYPTKDLKANGMTVPELKCAKCNAKASFSDIEEEYFAFMAYTK